MAYKEELQQYEWALKRLEILERDDFKCQRCFHERPVFRGLSKAFGVLKFDDLKNRGYKLFNPKNEPLSFDNLHFVNNTWPSQAHYIGDKNKAFELENLQFALQSLDVKVFGIVKKGYKLLCFYSEALTGQTLIDLNIHHKYYITGFKPWEYENNALITLCIDCHKLTHEETAIPVYSKDGNDFYTATTCERCGGSGYLPEYDYHINGVCFACWGEGVILIEE